MTATDPDSSETPRWRRHATIAAAVIVAITIVATSCGSEAGDSEPAAPFGTSDGAALYQSNCASCRGADLSGTDEGPSHLSIVYEPNHHGDDAFRSAIVNGTRQHPWNFGDMVAIPGLDDDQIDAIIGYVRSEQQRRGFDE